LARGSGRRPPVLVGVLEAGALHPVDAGLALLELARAVGYFSWPSLPASFFAAGFFAGAVACFAATFAGALFSSFRWIFFVLLILSPTTETGISMRKGELRSGSESACVGLWP